MRVGTFICFFYQGHLQSHGEGCEAVLDSAVQEGSRAFERPEKAQALVHAQATMTLLYFSEAQDSPKPSLPYICLS